MLLNTRQHWRKSQLVLRMLSLGNMSQAGARGINIFAAAIYNFFMSEVVRFSAHGSRSRKINTHCCAKVRDFVYITIFPDL